MAWDGTTRRRIQTGTISMPSIAAGGTGSVNVTFAVPFAAGEVPYVEISPNTTRLNVAPTSITNTGFTCSMANWSPSSSGAGTGTYTATL